MALAHEHVVQVDAQRAVGLGEELVGVLHVVLVGGEGVADQHRQRVAAAAAGAAALLAQVGDGVGEAPRQHAVERADVDAQLQRRRGHDAQQPAGEHVGLDAAAVLRRVAAAVAHDAAAALRPAQPVELLAHRGHQLLALLAHAAEGDDARAAQHDGAEQLRALEQRAAAAARRIAGLLERRVPAQELLAARRRSVGVDQQHVVEPEHGREVLARVGHRGRARHEARAAVADGRADAPQPPHDEGHVRAQQAVVVVQLVHHHERQVLQERAPPRLLRQHRHVQHVRVREDDPRLVADAVAVAPRRVAVERLDEQLAQARHVAHGLAQAALLVLRQRLGGEDVHGARVGVALERVQHRQLVDQRLARAGRRGHHHVAPRLQPVDGLGLVRVEARDALGVVQRVDQVLAHEEVEFAVHRLARLEDPVPVRHHLARVPWALLQLLHDLAHALPLCRDALGQPAAEVGRLRAQRPRRHRLAPRRHAARRLLVQRRLGVQALGHAPVDEGAHGVGELLVAPLDELRHLLVAVDRHPELLVPQPLCRPRRLARFPVRHLALQVSVDELKVEHFRLAGRSSGGGGGGVPRGAQFFQPREAPNGRVRRRPLRADAAAIPRLEHLVPSRPP